MFLGHRSSFFHTFCFLAVVLFGPFKGVYWELDYFNEVVGGSCIWTMLVVAIKKNPVLREKAFGDKKRRCLWTWLACVSMFVSENPVECAIVTVISFLVAISSHHLSKPSHIVYYLTIAYPCLPVDKMKKLEEAEQERLQAMEAERGTRLEWQYAALGGNAPPLVKRTTSSR